MVGTVHVPPADGAARRLRRRLGLVVGTVALITPLASVTQPVSAAIKSEATVVFDGGGYGHGVGLSQYGAKGQALDGRTAEDIVTHYYAGTEVAAAADLPIDAALIDQPLWVGLRQSLTRANFGWSEATGDICIDPDPGSESPCAKTVEVRVGEHVAMTWDASGGVCTLTKTKVNGDVVLIGKTAPNCRMSLASDPGGTMWFEGRGYPSGTIELRRAPGSETFHVTAVVDLETYVTGIAEVPSSWPAAAVEAQALAARSFALNRFLAHEKPELRAPGDAGLSADAKANCWCHLYDDTRSQVYGGIEAMDQARVDAAVATKGLVIAYRKADWASYTRSQVIEAYYSSSNGGRSMANWDSWGSPKHYPYLVAIEDPWSVAEATGNPYATWSAKRTASELAANLGWDQLTGAWLVSSNPGVVHFAGRDGGEPTSVELKGDSLRGVAGLLSGQVAGVRLEGTPSCRGYFATLWGTSQADTLLGTAGDDVIVGFNGPDIIEGRGGNDLICGNGGHDTIHGNSGADQIFSGKGNDTVFGGGGLDVLAGGGGADTLDGGNGADVVKGDKGLDTLSGGKGDDLLRGGLGGDTLDGGDGTDECRGGDGVDEALATCEVTVKVP